MKNNTNIKNGVSIIVPTFQRPKGIKCVLESLMTQTSGELAIEIIVVDNDPHASARSFVDQFSETSTIKIHYLHAPQPGVSNARNVALAAAKGRFLVFIDDDEEARPHWLENLLLIAKNHTAGICFGQIQARLENETIYGKYYTSIFSRLRPDLGEGPIDELFGCGNSLIDTNLCKLPNPPFSLAMNETGGEDDVLFGYLKDQGITIAWANKAICYEHVPASRTTPAYVKKRNFSFGQTPTQTCAEDKNYLGVLKWMLIGMAQYAFHKPLAIITCITRRPSYIKHLAKAQEGAGKIFWFSRFTPKLYGAAVVENKAL